MASEIVIQNDFADDGMMFIVMQNTSSHECMLCLYSDARRPVRVGV